MKQSQLFYKAKKDVPKGIEALSHKYLYRGDFIDQLGSGIYSFLPLGWKVHQKIADIIRDEMIKIGGQEVFLPALQPKQVWEITGRWGHMDPPLFTLNDIHKKEFALGSTHEEVMTKVVKDRVESYKDLPFSLFQIQTKFRNEIRSTGGLLRTREFMMKDLYSFHSDQKEFEAFYERAGKSYLKIFKRCGLKAKMVEASGAGFTKEFTHEFQALTPVGEDTVFYCENCDFARNKEIIDGLEKCPECGKKLISEKGIEIGNIFPLGTKYSESFDLKFKDKDGIEKPVIMASYGIGVGRLLAAIIEAHHDDNGIVWPEEVAPFKVHLIDLGGDGKLYDNLINRGVDVLLDDRDVSMGQKLAEADLIGIPYRLIVSDKNKGLIEIKERGKTKVELIKEKDLYEKLSI
jgi:prolyl-tRNA synthetase